eukprot:5178905-Pyramimonas_sp.AAC.1
MTCRHPLSARHLRECLWAQSSAANLVHSGSGYSTTRGAPERPPKKLQGHFAHCIRGVPNGRGNGRTKLRTVRVVKASPFSWAQRRLVEAFCKVLQTCTYQAPCCCPIAEPCQHDNGWGSPHAIQDLQDSRDHLARTDNLQPTTCQSQGGPYEQ